MSLDQYLRYVNRKLEDHSVAEIEASLTYEERLLAERYSLVRSQGKIKGYIYTIIPPEVKEAFDLLNPIREELGILEQNRFLPYGGQTVTASPPIRSRWTK